MRLRKKKDFYKISQLIPGKDRTHNSIGAAS